jgi:hypothetical protein
LLALKNDACFIKRGAKVLTFFNLQTFLKVFFIFSVIRVIQGTLLLFKAGANVLCFSIDARVIVIIFSNTP